MKNIKAIILLLLVILLTLTSCKADIDAKMNIKGEYSALKIGDKIDLQSGFTNVCETDKYRLSVNQDDLNIAVEDIKNGVIWYTNHPDSENDSIALSDMVDVLKSQLKIDYYDSNGNFGSVNSYSDCVNAEQYEINKIKNGIAIKYEIGNNQASVNDIPQKISDKRFREFVTKLSNKEQALISRKYYEYYEDDNLWIITSNGRENYERVLSLFKKSGYTEEDLAEDNRKYGISSTGNQRIYFTVVVKYILTENGLSVSIPCEDISYNTFYPPYEITLLPNFAAQRVTEENKNGFVLLPDGSGAIMNFNSDISPDFYYDAPVYGYDETNSLKQNSLNIQGSTVSMPVFGISNGQNGVLAYISDGAANASITAYRAGKNSSQFTVCPVFTALNMDYIKLAGTEKATTTSVFQKNIYEGDFCVDYLFCGGTYSDMANKAREYFLNKGILQKKDNISSTLPFYLETIGGAKGAKSVLGLSYSGIVAATTYEQNSIIADEFIKNGVSNIKVRMLGWCNGGMSPDCMAKIDLISSLGGKSGFSKLIDYCKEKGVEIFPEAEIVSGGIGNGEKKSNVARTLDSRVVETTEKTAVSDDTVIKTAYAYSPSRLFELSEKFIKSYKELGISTVSLADNARVIYPDYNDTLPMQYDRATAEKYIKGQTENVSKNINSIMMNGCNLYALKYADYAVCIDNDDSWFLCEDESVPFVQMVLHGLVNMGSKPLNLLQNDEFEILRCAEYGVAPDYRLCYEKTAVLKETEYSDNFSAYYKDWIKVATENWKKLNSVLSKVQGEQMTTHSKICDNVYKSEYSNGICVYVNYSKNDVMLDGITVPAVGFISGGVK